MNYRQILFSPTRGTQKVVERLTAAWDALAEIVDLCDRGTDFSAAMLTEGDVAVIAVPSYGGRVPVLAAERLASVQGGGARCVVVCVYGNRAYEDTLVELKDLAEKSGFRVVAAVAAVAEHSIIHRYAASRPDAEDGEELAAMGEKILAKLGAGDCTVPEVPGNRPYKKAGGGGLVPKADNSCVSCGLCAQGCPAGAIHLDDLKGTDGSKCISCMRCVVRCPQTARKVNGAMVSVAALAIKKACSVRKNSELYI